MEVDWAMMMCVGGHCRPVLGIAENNILPLEPPLLFPQLGSAQWLKERTLELDYLDQILTSLCPSYGTLVLCLSFPFCTMEILFGWLWHRAFKCIPSISLQRSVARLLLAICQAFCPSQMEKSFR
jgi:hypothetical protein